MREIARKGFFKENLEENCRKNPARIFGNWGYVRRAQRLVGRKVLGGPKRLWGQEDLRRRELNPGHPGGGARIGAGCPRRSRMQPRRPQEAGIKPRRLQKLRIQPERPQYPYPYTLEPKRGEGRQTGPQAA